MKEVNTNGIEKDIVIYFFLCQLKRREERNKHIGNTNFIKSIEDVYRERKIERKWDIKKKVTSKKKKKTTK